MGAGQVIYQYLTILGSLDVTSDSSINMPLELSGHNLVERRDLLWLIMQDLFLISGLWPHIPVEFTRALAYYTGLFL